MLKVIKHGVKTVLKYLLTKAIAELVFYVYSFKGFYNQNMRYNKTNYLLASLTSMKYLQSTTTNEIATLKIEEKHNLL